MTLLISLPLDHPMERHDGACLPEVFARTAMDSGRGRAMQMAGSIEQLTEYRMRAASSRRGTAEDSSCHVSL